MSKWKTAWKTAKAFMLLVLFWIGLAGVPANIGRWGKVFVFLAHYLNLEILRIGLSTFGLLGLAIVFLLPYLKPSLDIELIPSAGMSTEIALRVINHGSKRDFHAQCTPLAIRNSPNKIHSGTFDLKWEHTFDRCVSIGRGDSCNLTIAKIQTDHKNEISKIEILALYGTETKLYELIRCLGERFNPAGTIPEYDLEVSVLSDGAKGPMSERFTLRPMAWDGPLEMVKINPLQ
jgi:hypothetical protein